MLKSKNKKTEQPASASQAPSFFRVMRREIWNDKMALVAFFVLIALFAFVFIAAAGLDEKQVIRVTLGNKYQAPSAEHILGTDEGGRDIYSYILIGARNSILIAIGITSLCIAFGTFVGLVIGFFGGTLDNIVMRVVDFFSMLPNLMELCFRD